MSWTTAPEIPTRKVGPAWTTDAAPPARAYGQGWFSPAFIEKVTEFTAVGSLHAAVATSYPYSAAGFRSAGALTAIVRPKLALTVAFSGLGGVVGPPGEVKRTTAAFSAEGSNDGVTINDGFWGIVVGGVTPQDGLSGIIVGTGAVDGLTGTVTVGMGFSATGSLTAAVMGGVPGTPMTLPLSAVGSLAATVAPRTLANAPLAGVGALAATVNQLVSFPSAAAFAGSGALAATIGKALKYADSVVVSRDTSTTFTQSSNYSGVMLATYANMNDGAVTAGAATGPDATAYIQVDTGASQLIDHITIGYDYSGALGWGPYYTENASIQGSNNGTSWTNITTTPAYATSGSINGLVDVTINQTWRYLRLMKAGEYLLTTEFAVYAAVSVAGAPSGTGTLSATVTPKVPVITTVSPSSGDYADTITLTGTSFTGVTAVTIGGTAVRSLVVVSDTSITCKCPAGLVYNTAYDVVATSSAGSGTKTNGFTYDFASFAEADTPRSAVAIPVGTQGCYVFLVGGGGGGGGGSVNNTAANRYGGAGGGSGGIVRYSWIPVESLGGATYSVVRGAAGAGGGPGASAGSAGGLSRFFTAGFSWTAGGGGGGAAGTVTSPPANTGTGGAVTTSGLTPDGGTNNGGGGSYNGGGGGGHGGGGGQGGILGSTGGLQNGASGFADIDGAAAGVGGSGHGGSGSDAGSSVLGGGGGGAGGASIAATTSNYGGGFGGTPGAAGGGAGPAKSSPNNKGGNGAAGHTYIRWI